VKTVKKSSNPKARRWLFKRAAAARIWILLSVALGLSSGLLLIVQARYLSWIVHGAFIESRGTNALGPLFAILAGIIFLRAILGWARETAGFYAGAKVRQEVRTELLEHIIALGPGYTSRRSTGALTSTALEQVEGLHDFYAFYLPQLVLAVMIPAAIVAFIFPDSWAAGGLLLATAPLIPMFMILVGMGAESISQRHFQALARMSAYFLDVLQGISTLKLFNRSKGTEESVATVSNRYRLRTMGVLRVAFLSSAVLEFFSSISIALVAVYLAMSYLGYFSFGWKAAGFIRRIIYSFAGTGLLSAFTGAGHPLPCPGRSGGSCGGNIKNCLRSRFRNPKRHSRMVKNRPHSYSTSGRTPGIWRRPKTRLTGN